jgi:hypothetical protein
MLRKAALALGLAPIVGAVTAAQANDHADNWNEVGGYHIGPLGQRLGGTGFWPHWRGRGAYFGFAYVPRHHRIWSHF